MEIHLTATECTPNIPDKFSLVLQMWSLWWHYNNTAVVYPSNKQNEMPVCLLQRSSPVLRVGQSYKRSEVVIHLAIAFRTATHRRDPPAVVDFLLECSLRPRSAGTAHSILHPSVAGADVCDAIRQTSSIHTSTRIAGVITFVLVACFDFLRLSLLYPRSVLFLTRLSIVS